VITSPLLVRRARSSGGSGGIRVTIERDGDGYVVRTSGDRSREFLVADALAEPAVLSAGRKWGS